MRRRAPDRLGPPAWRWRLTVVVALGAVAALYAVGLHQELPYVYHPDEPTNVGVVRTMYAARTANPHFFNYPSLLFYVQALAQLPFALAHHARSIVIETPGNSRALDPAMVLAGRAVTALFALLTVALAGRVAARITGARAAALVAGGLVACSPLVSIHARSITPDVPTALFALGACAAALAILEGAGVGAYALGGVMVGLAAGTKYNAALAGLPIVVAHLLRRDRALRPLLVAAGAALAAFVVSTPYAVLDAGHFVAGVRAEADHYSSGHPGYEGGSPRYYLASLWRWQGPLVALALVPLILRRYRRPALVLASFAFVYLAFISSFLVHFERNELPALPPLLVLAGLGAWGLYERARSATMRVALVVVLGAAALVPVVQTARQADLATHDVRAAARRYLAGLPRGTRLAMEAYTPWADPTRDRVLPIVVGDHGPAWYVAHADYVVLGQGSYGRYYAQSRRYAATVRRYDELRRRFPLAARFDSWGYEVLVLRVGR